MTASAHRRSGFYYPSSEDRIALGADFPPAIADRALKRSSGTAQIASAAIRVDILLEPTLRSRKTIGTSVTRNPASNAR